MFTRMESAGTTDLHFCLDPASGLRAIIAIHSTHLGPAIGGCRFLPYANELDAVEDALKLAKGMSYKAALAGLPHGGGKSVIIYPEHEFDRHKLMKAFGKFIEALNGHTLPRWTAAPSPPIWMLSPAAQDGSLAHHKVVILLPIQPLG